MTAFYIYRDSGPEGPFSEEQIREGLTTGRFNESDKIWYNGLRNWTPIMTGALTGRTGRKCPQCETYLTLQVENPQRSTGIIVTVLGILFAPFCIGIFLLIWGLTLVGETKSYWHCPGCGRTFPA
jgi:hypothetical protein